MRTPRIQTTIHLPITGKRSDSKMTEEEIIVNEMKPTPASAISQSKSNASGISNTNSATVSQDQYVFISLFFIFSGCLQLLSEDENH